MSKYEPQIDQGYTFEINAGEFLNYATAFNGRPFVRAVSVRSNSLAGVLDATVSVSLTAQGVNLSQVWSKQIGFLGSDRVVFDDVRLHFDSEVMLQQTEPRPAEIRMSITVGEQVIASTFWSVTLQSPDSWILEDGGQMSLAAFVQPQHPAIRGVLDSALNILRDGGYTPSWTGYQDSSAVGPMVRSIYQALVNEKLAYSDPPSSWDLDGQQTSGMFGQHIRSAQTILSERVATCLDSALLFASALESIGLAPVVAVIPGHAFVGFWTPQFVAQYGEGGGEQLRSISSAANLIDLGYIEIFETTSICEGLGKTYDEATKESYSRLINKNALGEKSHKSIFVDIVECRRPGPNSVHSLPARFVKPDGTVEIVEYRPVELTPGMLRDRIAAAGNVGSVLAAAAIDAPAVVKRWLDSLLDLSLRNPLINFREPKSSISLVTVPDSLGSIEDLLQQNKALKIQANQMRLVNVETGEAEDANLLNDRQQVHPNTVIDNKGTTLENYVSSALNSGAIISNLGPDANVNALRKMASSAKTFFEETGSNGLYLALGSLVWTPKDHKAVRSPLILVPVNLVPKNRSKDFELVIDTRGQVTPNYSLAEKLLREEKVALDKLVDLEDDDNGINVAKTFTHVRERLSEAGIEGFRVDENAVLGFFNFSTYRLWQDMVDNWKTFTDTNVLVKHLVETPSGEFSGNSGINSDSDLDAIISKLPISADSSQALAVSDALKGKTFVLQGPPGTGKSQTITNLLALALSEGKRVLFVAEKKDALDVVKERLDKAGLGAFSLDLHDKGMTPKSVREQLLGVIDIAIDDDKIGFDGAVREYETAISPLNAYRARLHEVGTHGESLYSALDHLLAVPAKYAIDVPGSFIAQFGPELRTSLYESAKTVSSFGLEVGNATQNPWSLSSLRGQLELDLINQIGSVTSRLAESFASISADTKVLEFLQNVESLQEFVLLRSLALEEAELPKPSNDATQKQARKQALQTLDLLVQDIATAGFSLERLETIELEAWLGEAQVAATSSGLFRNSKLNGIKKKLGMLLGQDLSFEPGRLIDVLSLLRAIKARVAQARTDVSSVTGFRFDTTTNLFVPSQVTSVITSIRNMDALAALYEFSHAKGPQASEIGLQRSSAAVQALIALLPEVATLMKLLSTNDMTLSRWIGEQHFGARLAACIPLWSADNQAHASSSLTRWSALLEEITAFNAVGLKAFGEEVLSGRVPFDEAPNAFLRGYYKAVLDNLIHQRGFNTFEAMTITNAIRKLDESQSEIRTRLPRILGAKLLAGRGFDSSAKTGSVNDLITVLKAPRSKMSIRAMLKRFWPEIMKITPCVLASPDSVVRFIDAGVQPFDLVVFDEASQIRVANSIGALGRGRAAVVVGDSKQMPPTSVAQVKNVEVEDEELAEEGEDEIFVKDSESILSLASDSNVPSVMLKWHYRSENESLIAYSNKRYYENSLSTFPSPSTDRTAKGLSFKHVPNGVFVRPGMSGVGRRGTNPAEVDEIIKDLAKRLKDPETANDSIGIVTFNKEQMDEIKMRLLDSKDAGIQKAMAEGVGGEEIFVKNLETVQGSERDVILFSVAFSHNTKGYLSLNFGPLGQQGGQRRLNVAITRARKQVRVFCSFLPEQLMQRNPTAPGVLHLAEFLTMANQNADAASETFRVRESKADRHRHDIALALQAAGLSAVEEVGMSEFKVDIAVFDPKKPDQGVLAILLDGPRWNSRSTVSDRDVLPVEQLLHKKGWPAVERIWVAAWLRDPSGEIERIKKAFDDAKKAPKKTVESAGPAAVEPIFTVLRSAEVASNDPVGSLLDEVAEWEELILVDGTKIPKEYLDNLAHPDVVGAIQTIAEKLTAKEGPVSPERLGKYVASCFGFDRVPADRIEAINNVSFPGHARDNEDFLYPKDVNPSRFSIWRHSANGSGRSVQDISLVELSNAMHSIVKAAQRIRVDVLGKETSRLFGIQKVSAATDLRMQAAIKFGLENGKLLQIDDYFESK